jgi:hypothetical protein
MKKQVVIIITLILCTGIFVCAKKEPSINGAKSLATQETVYGIVPKGKYWMLYTAENRSTAGQFYYIDGKAIDAIYTGSGCHPYCYKSWLPDGKKLFEGESVGIKGGNGIYYIYNEYSVGGVE